jgi:carboxyl-terminal processing protease
VWLIGFRLGRIGNSESMKKIFVRIVGTAALLVLSFIFGVSWHDLRGVRSFPELVNAVNLIPQRIDMALLTAANAQDGEYTPYQNYADVLSTLKANLYGPDIDSTQMTYNGIRGMMGSLGDRYTRFMDPSVFKETRDENMGEFVGIGAMLQTNAQNQVYVVRVLPGGPALKYHVMAGDIIIKVDNTPTLKLTDVQVVKLIRGQPDTKVRLTLLRKSVSHPVVITIPRAMVQEEVVRYQMLDADRKIGYIALAGFNEESDVQIERALDDLQSQGARGIVLDLRSNPGGLLDSAQRIASRFIPAGPVLWMKDRTGPMQPLDTIPGIHRSRLPLVVLVNEDSASAAEIVSGAIKDTDSGILVGEKTFGKGVVQTYFPLRDGSAVAITTQHYFTASKHDINHKGIEPNITVPVSDSELRALTTYERIHPDSAYDLQDDGQLQRAVVEVETRMRVANAKAD